MFDSVFSVLTMIAVITVIVFYFFIKKKEGKDWVYAIYFIAILITGTALYSIGLVYGQDKDTAEISPLFVIAQAIGMVLKSFGGDFKPSVFSALAKENIFYQIAIFTNFIAAIILTFLIAIKLFGRNAVNRFRVFMNSFRSKYIIIGAVGQAGIFLKSLDYQKRKRTTVILEAKHKDKKKDLMFQGFSVIVVKDDEDKQSKKKSADNQRNVFAKMHEALKIAGFARDRHDTKIIAMSEEDEQNLLAAKIVTDYIAGVVNPTKGAKGKLNKLSAEQENKLNALKLSAHIMYKMLDRTEHFAFSEYALGRVRFFNPDEVRARKFMTETPITSLIPRAWIHTKKARLFNAGDKGCEKNYRIGNFFVGYGQTNQNIMRKSICNYQLLGVDYNALVIDKDAKNLAKQFQNSAPGLWHEKDENNQIKYGSELMPNPNGSVYYPNPKEKYNISFADLNVLSSDFYQKIIQEISGTENRNGYDFVSIVIALGNDQLSIETALELRQKLYERQLLRSGSDKAAYDRVRIFVKIIKNTVLSDFKLLNDKNGIDNEIVVFGASEEILNESYIIDEKLDFIAKRIANDYWKTAGADTQKSNIVSKWDSLSEFKRDSNRYAAMSIRTKLNLLGFEFSKSKTETDKLTIEAYEAAYGTEISERQRAEKEKGKFVDFAERDKDGNIVDNARNNLARLEHQRWNTLHLVRGWTKLPISKVTAATRQDEKAKQHACITTFEGLSDLRKRQADDAIAEANKAGEKLCLDKALSDSDTICYDFNVMDRLYGNLKDSGYIVKEINQVVRQGTVLR